MPIMPEMPELTYIIQYIPVISYHDLKCIFLESWKATSKDPAISPKANVVITIMGHFAFNRVLSKENKIRKVNVCLQACLVFLN